MNFVFEDLPYTRPDFGAARDLITAAAEEIRRAESFRELQAAKERVDALESELFTTLTIAEIRNTLDTTDPFYEEEQAVIDREMPLLSPAFDRFHRALAESPFVEEIDRTYGRQLLEQIRLQMKQYTPDNIPLMQREAELCTAYQKLIASCQVEFDGERRNLYGLQKYFESTDRAVRRAAFRAYSGFFSSHEAEMAEIFDELVRVRNQMGVNLGYRNFIPLGYMQQGRTDYGEGEVAAYRRQVREDLVPFCRELYAFRARLNGLDKCMAYDEQCAFPDGNVEPVGNEDELVERARQMYHELSPETAEFIDYMIEHHLMDLKNKPGKAATGYMTSLPKYRAPFVFSCFNHTKFDAEVLTHELGHAFAGYEAMRAQSEPSYWSGSTDIAEIHSMSMEQFAYPWAHLFFGDAADKYRFAHLFDAITFVPFGVAVDEFQHIVYEHPELTPDQRTAEWHKLEEIYMPFRQYEDDPFMERGGYWYHKIHIFLYPFYYINYTLTTLGAMEFKGKMERDRSACWQDYLTLCRDGSAYSYLELLRRAHLSVPFETGAVKRVMAYPISILRRQMKEIAARYGV